MVDRLNGLRHYAVVGSHHQDGDIRRLSASHPHGGKGLMAGRIQERNSLSIVFHNVGADMLGDSAGLLRRYIRLTDRVQKRGFAVVDMAHNADDRRSGNHILLVLLVLL